MALNIDTLLDGRRHLILRIRVNDDATHTDSSVVDISTLTGPDGVTAPSSLSVEYIQYSMQGYEFVRLEWDHTTDEPIAIMSGDGYMDFREFGGIHDSGSGGNGDILLSTPTVAAGDTADITIKFKKKD